MFDVDSLQGYATHNDSQPKVSISTTNTDVSHIDLSQWFGSHGCSIYVYSVIAKDMYEMHITPGLDFRGVASINFCLGLDIH